MVSKYCTSFIDQFFLTAIANEPFPDACAPEAKSTVCATRTNIAIQRARCVRRETTIVKHVDEWRRRQRMRAQSPGDHPRLATSRRPHK